MFRLLILAALVAAPVAAFAQSTTEPTTPNRCLLGSKSFSPGATIRSAGAVQACSADGTWGTTEQTASGCFYADAFYSVGATSAVSGNRTMLAVCQADGSWSTSTIEPPKS
jgi:hypothetical protein